MKILTIKWSKEFKGKKIKNINHKIKAKIKMIKKNYHLYINQNSMAIFMF